MQDNSTEKKYPTSAKELRLMYGVCVPTWRKYLEPLRDLIPLHTKVYTPKQVNAIIKHLDPPN